MHGAHGSDARVSGYVGGKRSVVEAIRAGHAEQVLVAEGTRETAGMRAVFEAASSAGITIDRVPRRELDSLVQDHRGVVAKTSVSSGTRGLSERDISTFDFGAEAVVVVLDGVTDPQNLGAAARAADAAGAQMLVTRVRRAAGVTEAAIRASAGALVTMPHAHVANIPRALERLKDAGFAVAGLDAEAPRSIYEEPCPGGKLALVIGSEGSGMSRLAREHCDVLVSLPMRGTVASLNASASLAAALFGWAVPSRGLNSGAKL